MREFECGGFSHRVEGRRREGCASPGIEARAMRNLLIASGSSDS